MRRALGALHAFVKSRYFYPAVFVACLYPAFALAYEVYQGDLGVNPVETLEHETGEDTLCLLLLCLSITPLRRLTGWNKLQTVRRMVGVWSFVYALGHVSMYLVFDQNCYSLGTCDAHAMWIDLTKRKFIFVGALAFTILFLLAVTSTNGWIRRLKHRWTSLHRWVYVAGAAGVVHFIWGLKVAWPNWVDVHSGREAMAAALQVAGIEPLKWALWLTVVLGIRAYYAARARRVRAPVAVRRPVTS